MDDIIILSEGELPRYRKIFSIIDKVRIEMDNLIIYSEVKFDGLSVRVYSKEDGFFFADNLIVYDDNNIELWRICDLFPMTMNITVGEVWKIDDRTMGVYNLAGIKYEIDVYKKIVKKETYARY